MSYLIPPSIMSEEFIKEAKAAFNGLSAELGANLILIPSYEVLAGWGFVRPKADIQHAAMGLIELSITFGDPDEDYQYTWSSIMRVQDGLNISSLQDDAG